MERIAIRRRWSGSFGLGGGCDFTLILSAADQGKDTRNRSRDKDSESAGAALR
jgi:hypothetical protein